MGTDFNSDFWKMGCFRTQMMKIRENLNNLLGRGFEGGKISINDLFGVGSVFFLSPTLKGVKKLWFGGDWVTYFLLKTR